MVLVEKKMGKLRVYIDYGCLNKAFQKHHFLLLFVNQILDEVAIYELYTFINGYYGLNQVSIDPYDYHKIPFTTPWGTLIYVGMPFGLCSASATFQRVMTSIFLNLLHNSILVFIEYSNNVRKVG